MEAILDAIFDFGPLECEEKMAPEFFVKLMISSFKIKSVFAFTKQNTRIFISWQMSLH